MEQTKYDVFISYSRKDYVRDNQVIPGNPITAIQELFDHNGISYWFDKDGIYSGQEFIEVISNAIANSKMLVFVSSNHSNASMWTAGEIFEAVDGKKLIIPVRIDDCPYNKKFKLLIRPLDYVDYQGQPNTALPQLLRAVNSEKERLVKIEKEERQRFFEKQMEAKREAVKNEIKEKAKEYQALAGQQDYILKELYSKNKFIGNTIKRCPVCEKEEPIQSQFCSQCGWQFPKLYGIDGGNVPLHDEAQLAIARKYWKDFSNIATLQKENENLKVDKRELEKSLSDIKTECEKHLKDIDRKDSQLAAFNRELESFKEKNAEIEKRYKELEQKQKEIEENRIQEDAKRKAEEVKREEEMRRGNFTVNGVSFKMIRVEGGTFMMGATNEQGDEAYKDEKPAHQVTLSDYSIGEIQVTQELWEAIMGSNPSRFRGANRPVEKVSWDDCIGFISELSKLTGKSFRLPTEAEWEFAARGGKKGNGCKYAGSNDIDAVAWYDGNSGRETHPVGQKQPNELGLYDMSGNVWEWCQDWKDDYSSNAQTNPTGRKSGYHRVYRGGSWDCNARDCRSSYRGKGTLSFNSSSLGLRLAL